MPMNESVSKEKRMNVVAVREKHNKIDSKVHVLILYQSTRQAGETLINKTLFPKIHLRLFRARGAWQR